MNDDDIKNMLKPVFDIGQANQLLSSSIIKYLVDKQLIDLKDYIEYNTDIQNKIVENLDDDGEKAFVKYVFTNHRMDFDKPQ